MPNNITQSLKILLLALVLSIGVSYAYAAWTAPTQPPPGGNIATPVNIGDNAQIKEGNLMLNNTGGFVNGLIVRYGNVGIGDLSPDGLLKLDVEGQVGATEYCDENGGNCTAATALGGSGSTGDISTTQIFPAVPLFTGGVPSVNNSSCAAVGSWSLGGYTLVNTKTVNVPISATISGSPIATTYFKFDLNIDGVVGSVQSGPPGAGLGSWSDIIPITLPAGVHNTATLSVCGNNISGGTVNVGPLNAQRIEWYSL